MCVLSFPDTNIAALSKAIPAIEAGMGGAAGSGRFGARSRSPSPSVGFAEPRPVERSSSNGGDGGGDGSTSHMVKNILDVVLELNQKVSGKVTYVHVRARLRVCCGGSDTGADLSRSL